MKFDGSFFLRIGLAFVFIYVAVSAFFYPEIWIGFLPNFLGNSVTKGYFLLAHDVFGVGLGLWLLSGKKTFYAAVVSSVMLAAIVLTNLGSLLIVFRDIGLFFAAVALAVLSKRS
jgi:hypothetical protein